MVTATLPASVETKNVLDIDGNEQPTDEYAIWRQNSKFMSKIHPADRWPGEIGIGAVLQECTSELQVGTKLLVNATSLLFGWLITIPARYWRGAKKEARIAIAAHAKLSHGVMLNAADAVVTADFRYEPFDKKILPGRKMVVEAGTPGCQDALNVRRFPQLFRLFNRLQTSVIDTACERKLDWRKQHPTGGGNVDKRIAFHQAMPIPYVSIAPEFYNSRELELAISLRDKKTIIWATALQYAFCRAVAHRLPVKAPIGGVYRGTDVFGGRLLAVIETAERGRVTLPVDVHFHEEVKVGMPVKVGDVLGHSGRNMAKAWHQLHPDKKFELLSTFGFEDRDSRLVTWLRQQVLVFDGQLLMPYPLVSWAVTHPRYHNLFELTAFDIGNEHNFFDPEVDGFVYPTLTQKTVDHTRYTAHEMLFNFEPYDSRVGWHPEPVYHVMQDHTEISHDDGGRQTAEELVS
jgi:hypothetical protein